MMDYKNKDKALLCNTRKYAHSFISFLFLIILQACSSLEFSGHDKSYHPPLPKLKNIRVAFVLGGGGAKGMAHLGVMEELFQHGIHPDLIVGCSAGAIVGGLYADNPNINTVRQTLLKQRRENLLNLSLDYLPFGLSNGEAMEEFLAQQLSAKTFDELKIPFVSVATNLEFGDLTVFGTGELSPAIRASAAFPGVFLPVQIEGQWFVDGGVANPVPVSIARKLGAQFVIAIELGDELVNDPPSHIFGILKRSLEISYQHHSHMASHGADFVIRVPFKDVGTFDNDKNNLIYNTGRETARKHASKLLARYRLFQKIKQQKS